MLRRVRTWLANPPVPDPVDRRNAPMFQVVMLLLATAPPLLWAYRVSLLREIPWREGETWSLLSSLVVCATAAFAFVLVRRGRFQWAVRQVLATVAVAMLAAYATTGLGSQMFEVPLQLMWLFVSGTMVGRRALWTMFLVLCAALFLGAASDFNAGRIDGNVFGDALIRSVMFLLIAIVIDRSSSALRGSLAEATARGAALAAANAKLRDEIEARERIREQLLHAQRVEAVGRMASGVAHDFNHLLGLVLGYAARGRAAASGQADVEEAFAGVESAARRGVAVAGKLTSFSRREVARVDRFDAGDAVREMLPMLRQTLGAGIVLAAEIADAPLPVRFDRAQLELVLLNLAANAAHAMPDGGRATLALQGRDGAMHLALSDTGHGMAADVAARALEPFFTTKPAGQGTGLGLAVAADLLGDAGGGIRLETAPGAGTTVHLTLPLATGDGGAQPAAGYQASA